MPTETTKSLESWLWDAACSIRGAKDAPKFKDYILPLVLTKRLCDVFDDEINRITKEVGSRAKAFKLVKADKKLVRFFLPLVPKNPDGSVWSVIRTGSDATRPADDKYQEKLGQEVTTYMRAIADANPLLKGIVDRIDFNATTHGQRDIDDLRLSHLIEAISGKRLGLTDVEGDNLIGVRCQEGVDPQFLYHWSLTFDLRKITDPGPTPQLNKKDLVPVLMPVPRDIAKALDAVDYKFDSHRRKHATLSALFRTS